MDGLGTNDSQLQYLIARCREPSLMEPVKRAYFELFGIPLREAIASETRGDYKTLLLEIIGS
jgi:annexin A7/11